MEHRPNEKPKFYLKWPWDLAVYILLAVGLRLFAVPVILLLMRWNQGRQPAGNYCLRRTRGRLSLLVWAALLLVLGGAAALLLPGYWAQDRAGWEGKEYFTLILCAALAVGGPLAALGLGYAGIRDAFFPGKSKLARSIRAQLPYPEEAPPVGELFGMVDRDILEQGEWFGRLAIGSQWVLGDQVSFLPRVRGVFSRDERRTHRSGGRVRTSRTIQLWLVDDRQQCQCTDLRSPDQLQGALDCLRRRLPDAVFGRYGSAEYDRLVYADEEEAQRQELDYRRRVSARQEKEGR